MRRIEEISPVTQADRDKWNRETPAEWDARITKNRLSRTVQNEFERLLKEQENA